MSRSCCAVDGCDVDARSDGLLYRVSPKGTPFHGMCPEHFREFVDDLHGFLEHGDDAHRGWLHDAITAFFAGRQRPPVR